LREHRQRFDALLIVGDPIYHGVAVAPELVGRHVEGGTHEIRKLELTNSKDFRLL
jgi:hypothetical protein